MESEIAILVVDDEPNLRRTLAIILNRAGYHTYTASNSQEALQMLEAGCIDMAFLDLKMPQVDGLSLLADIQKLHPDIPVLILTAHATIESAIEAVRKGANDYLLKPIDPDHILMRVKHILEENQQMKRRREILVGLDCLVSELTDLEKTIDHNWFELPDVQSRCVEPGRYIHRGAFMVDLHTRQVTIEERSISLSPTAFDYLVTLLRNSPNVMTCEKLVQEAQGYQASKLEAREMARWRVHELRKAIEPDPRRPQYIITVRGNGYRLLTQ